MLRGQSTADGNKPYNKSLEKIAIYDFDHNTPNDGKSPLGVVFVHDYEEDQLSGEYSMNIYETGHIRQLEGKLLTFLEALMPTGKQLEAQKSILRTTLWDWYRENELSQLEVLNAKIVTK